MSWNQLFCNTGAPVCTVLAENFLSSAHVLTDVQVAMVTVDTRKHTHAHNIDYRQRN